MIARGQQVDGVIICDMVCGTTGRPCPKIGTDGDQARMADVRPFRIPPTCIYAFPAVAPGQVNHHATPQALAAVELLQAFHNCFKGRYDEVNYGTFAVEDRGGEVWRKTTILRGGVVQRESEMMAIRRG